MGISRRALFKLTGASLAGAALPGLGLAAAALEPDAPRRRGRRVSGQPLHPVASACGGCPAGCAVIGWQGKQERLEQVTGHPADPAHQGKLCPRGLAGPNFVHDPDRLLYPLKRSGPRGAGRFARASWDEALAALGARLGELAAAGRGEELALVGPYDPAVGLAAERLAAACGSPNAWHPTSAQPANLAAALRRFWGDPGLHVDLEHARLALLFGGNPHEGSPWRIRPADAEWIVLDPRCSNTAGGPGCRWLPLPPGSDGLVALGLAHLVLREGRHDRRFLARWTKLQEADLVAHLAPYTPERVRQVTGICATDLVGLARRLAGEPRTALWIGDSAVAHAQGVQTAGAILLLATLLGRVETVGGLQLPRRVPLAPPRLGPKTPRRSDHGPFGLEPPPAEPLAPLAAADGKLDTLLVWGGDPVWGEAGGARLAAWLADERKVGLLAVAATTLNETARLADWVLPATPWPESWGLAAPAASGPRPYVALRRPLSPPPGEARSPLALLLELGRAAGEAVAAHFPFPGPPAFLEALLHRADRLRDDGGVEALLARGPWVDPVAVSPPGFHEEFLPATASEKLECKLLTGKDSKTAALPGWSAPAAPPPPGTLALVLHHEVSWRSAEDAGSKWLDELARPGRVQLHAATAARLGLADGAAVEVVSDQGSYAGVAWVGEGIHPDAVAVLRGGGHRAGSRIAQGRPFGSADPDTRRLAGPASGDNPTRLVAPAPAPGGGGQAWGGTRVTVRRAGGPA